MKRITRRDFIKNSMATGLAFAAPAWAAENAPFPSAKGANNQIRVAIVGFRGKGKQHIEIFRQLPDVRIVALCDADREYLDLQAEEFAKRNEKVDTYVDLRHVLDRKDIDAVVTATPNHWHALLTIWACQAGKDVYVEKPVSHNIWEGQKMIEAARKYKRIVQSGTQSRSDQAVHDAFDYIRKGNLGKIQLVRGFCHKRRKSIGKVDGPQPVPESADYNLWTGPAPLQPLMRKRLHYDWHWVWPNGNGDLGNRGVHDIDMIRWALGYDKLPPRVLSIGGRFGYDDDGQTPNTQIIFIDYKPVPIIFEVRGLPRKKDDPGMDNYRGIRKGFIIQCENGYYAGGMGGGWTYDNDGKKIKQFAGDGGGGHQANFIKAVRSRNVADLNCDILEGHLSSAICHMANLSHRIGAESSTDQIAETLKGDKVATETFERFQTHLEANEVDLKKTPATLGPCLEMDPDKEEFIGKFAPQANKLLSRNYRKPFVVPEQV